MEEGYYYGSFSKNNRVKGMTQPLWSRETLELRTFKTIPDNGMTTFLDGFNHARLLFPEKNCLGHRVGDAYQWLNYEEAGTRASNIAKAMNKLRLCPL
jgi:hypothetical protein